MKEAVLIAVLASMVAQANLPWTGGAAAAETKRLQGEIDAASERGGDRVVVTAQQGIVIRGNAKSPVRDIRLENFRAKIEAPDPLVVVHAEGVDTSGLKLN